MIHGTASTPGSERASNNKGLFAWESEPPLKFLKHFEQNQNLVSTWKFQGTILHPSKGKYKLLSIRINSS